MGNNNIFKKIKKIALILFLFIQIGLIMYALYTKTTNNSKIDKYGIETKAVIRYHYVNKGRKYVYIFSINGCPYKGTISDAYGGVKVGDTVTVRYVPSDPKINKAINYNINESTKRGHYVVSAIIVICIGSFVALCFYADRINNKNKKEL